MTPEEIEKKWKTFESLLKRLSDDNILNLIDSIGQRIIMSPASQRSDQYGAYPGGLVEHSLNVASFLRNANEVYNHGLDMNSIIKVSLLHDIGKIGDLENDLFLVQDSDWHREKLNQEYKYNENISKMSVSHRTLFLLQHFGVSLTKSEWLAIQLAQGSHFEENRFYVGHEPTLAIALQQAKAIAVHKIDIF
jgi:predicted HD phosphohydrolase